MLLDKQHSAATYRLSSKEDSSLRVRLAFSVLGARLTLYGQVFWCRQTSVALINLRSHLWNKVPAVGLVVAWERTRSALWVHPMSHRVITTETSPGNLHIRVCSLSQSETYTGLNIRRSGRDGMSLVFRTLHPEQDAVQNKMQHN